MKQYDPMCVTKVVRCFDSSSMRTWWNANCRSKDEKYLDPFRVSKYFSSLDLRSAFHQVCMDKESKHLTTFVTHIGSYCFIRMPYGVVNAPATFQKLMERVLRHLQWHICMAYLDDKIVFSKDFRLHLDNLEQVFDRL